MNQINRQVMTLPSLEAQQQQYYQSTSENHPVTVESTFDLKEGMGLKKPTSYDTRCRYQQYTIYRFFLNSNHFKTDTLDNCMKSSNV